MWYKSIDIRALTTSDFHPFSLTLIGGWLSIQRGGYHVIPGRVTFSSIGCQGVCLEGPGANRQQANVRAWSDAKLVWKSRRHLSSRLQLACQSPGSQGLTTPSESSQDVAAPGSQVIRGLISPSDPLQGSKKLTKHFFTHCQSNDLKVQQMSGMVKFSYMPFELQVNVKLHSVHVLKHPCVRVCFVILYFRLSGAFKAPQLYVTCHWKKQQPLYFCIFLYICILL